MSDTPSTMGRRLRTTAPSDWSDETRAILAPTVANVAGLEEGGGEAAPTAKPLNILATIAHHPTLLRPFLEFSAALAVRGVLARRDSELLALRAAWNARSDFEWGHHVRYAQSAGLSELEISRVVEGADADGWSDGEVALLRAADELHADDCIGDATWRQLSRHFDEAQLVEIPFVVGQYRMLSGVARSLGVELESGYEPLPGAGGKRRDRTTPG